MQPKKLAPFDKHSTSRIAPSELEERRHQLRGGAMAIGLVGQPSFECLGALVLLDFEHSVVRRDWQDVSG